MALKDIWKDKIDGQDDVLAEDINTIAHSSIKNEEDILNIYTKADLRYYYGTENITPTPGSCFTYIANVDGTCTITGWTDEFVGVVDCVIPYQIDGLLVTSIGFAAFGDKNFHGGIRSVIMPNSITYLSGRAFAGCYVLSKVRLSEGLRYIGSYDGSGVISENNYPSFVFENTAISELEIPKSVIAVDTSIVYTTGNNSNYCFSKLTVHSPETVLITATGWFGIKILCHKGSLAEQAISSVGEADQVVYFDFDPNDVPIPEYVNKAGTADTARKATTADTASVAGRLLPTITYYGSVSKVGFFKIAEVASGSRGFTAIISASNLNAIYNFSHAAVVNFSFGFSADEDLSKITQIAGNDITHKICYVRNTETNAWSIYYYREKGEPVNITFVNVYKDNWIGQSILFASAEDYTVLDTELDTTNAIFATYYPAERERAFSNVLKGTASGEAVGMHDVSPLEHTMGVKVRSKNLFDKNNYNVGYRVKNTDGTLSQSTNYSSSDYIPVESGKIYTVSGYATADSTTKHIAFYDSNKVFVSGDTMEGTITVPTNAVYMRKSLHNDDVETYQIEEGTTATPYTPYVPDVTAVSLKKYGKNLFDGVLELGIWSGTNGKPYDNDTRIRSKNFIKVTEGVSYIITFEGYDVACLIYEYDRDYNYIPTNGTNLVISHGKPYTPTNGVKYIHFAPSSTVTAEVIDTIKCQMEVGIVATEYEPYKEPVIYTPNADGTVEGVTSLYPSTTLLTDTEGVVIDCEYNRDINKAFEELTQAILVLGGGI